MKTMMTASPPPLRLTVESSAYLGIAASHAIRDRLDLVITDRAYLPSIDDPERDWVASVAAPAFKLLRQRRGAEACRAFCAIGTGAGLDALAAAELLGAQRIGLTDLFDEVVAAAAANLRRNLRPGTTVTIEAGAGDLLSPLLPRGPRFDLIYENLPNLPLADDRRLEIDRTSAAFVPTRTEAVPPFVRDGLLVLHYLALVQAREALAENGALIATIGARLPLALLGRMAEAAGYRPSFLTFGWKVQADAEEVIGGYAEWESRGLGPFGFYRAERLKAVFGGLDPEQAGRDALAIEAALAADRLEAGAALAALRQGERIGHTVAVLHATPRSSR